MVLHPTVPLGISAEHVRVGDHIAYFWSSDAEFANGVRFLEAGLAADDCCILFGYQEANQRVLDLLASRGYDVAALQQSGRLRVIGGDRSGHHMLATIGQAFQAMTDRGCSLIRLLGNLGWGREGWPDEADILEFEAKVTAAARQFPCVVVCMYDVQALSGRIVLHGALQTHPLTICGNVTRENPFYVRIEEFLSRYRKAG